MNNSSPKLMQPVTENEYLAGDGTRMTREYGETPNGNPLHGRWVLRNPIGELVDFDQYRNDLAERNNVYFWLPTVGE